MRINSNGLTSVMFVVRRSVLGAVLIFVLCSIAPCDSQSKQEVVLQIIMPFQSLAEKDLQFTHLKMKHTIQTGREIMYRHLRKQFIINSWLNFTETETPSEILNLFCIEVFSRHVNTIMSFNYGHGAKTVAANDYILKLAAHLGYPIISWDPEYPGALQSIEESRVLQIAPTIYHQCQALVRILTRYNWTEFSIVTTQISSNHDFISCMQDQVKQTSTTQGYLTHAKFTILSSIIIDLDQNDSWEKRGKMIQTSLKAISTSVSRVILLHAGAGDAKDILDEAEVMGFTGSEYMWILTSFSVGTISRFAGSSYPIGTIGIIYNDSISAIQETMRIGIKIWALGLESIARNPDLIASMKVFPNVSCNYTNVPYWTDGDILYEKMKNARIDKPPVSFTRNGIIEHVELNIVNVRPFFDKRSGRVRQRWDKVGLLVPTNTSGKIELSMQMDEVVWPGGSPFPPRGKPEKKFFRIATLREPPYIIYEPPDADTGVCNTHAVPCKLIADWKYGNTTVNNGTVNWCCTGLCVDLLKILSNKMNFDYEMYEVADRNWGIQDDDTGEWNGLIREMEDGKGDMVITSLKINHKRNTAIDFSIPYLETGITIIVSIRKGAISATAFLEPFDILAWILILLLCIHVVSLSIFIMEYYSPRGMNRGIAPSEPYDYPSWCLILVFSVHATGASIFIFEWLSPSGLNQGKTPLREHKFSLFRSFWLIWAMLFGASVTTDNPRGMASRFLSSVWALFALVFLASYTANLAAFMITIDEYYDLSGIQDWRLMNPTAVTPHFRFATVPGGSTEDNLKKNYPRMHKYMAKYNKSDVDIGIDALKRQEIHAFIYDATVLEYRAGRDKDCDLITVGKWYAMTGYGVGFPRGSPYVDQVNTILLELQHNGELERLQKFWLSGACHAQKDKKDHSSHNIGILNFTSAFILLAGGVVLGALLLALEHMYFKFGRKCLKKYDKCGCCALVSLSMGKSLTFEQSVMEAIDLHRRHRCKDPMCETQLWKARHELDLALIKIDRLQTELSSFDKPVDGTTTPDQIEVKFTEPNGLTSQLSANRNGVNIDKHYELPETSVDRISNKSDGDRSMKSVELTDFEIRRMQFRRSPSYTNAMSTDSDCKTGDTGRPPSYNACMIDASPKRCPSYSQAVEDSPVLDVKSYSPKSQSRTRYYDGKYYVGVPNDQDESAL